MDVQCASCMKCECTNSLDSCYTGGHSSIGYWAWYLALSKKNNIRQTRGIVGVYSSVVTKVDIPEWGIESETLH